MKSLNLLRSKYAVKNMTEEQQYSLLNIVSKKIVDKREKLIEETKNSPEFIEAKKSITEGLMSKWETTLDNLEAALEDLKSNDFSRYAERDIEGVIRSIKDTVKRDANDELNRQFPIISQYIDSWKVRDELQDYLNIQESASSEEIMEKLIAAYEKDNITA